MLGRMLRKTSTSGLIFVLALCTAQAFEFGNTWNNPLYVDAHELKNDGSDVPPASPTAGPDRTISGIYPGEVWAQRQGTPLTYIYLRDSDDFNCLQAATMCRLHQAELPTVHSAEDTQYLKDFIKTADTNTSNRDISIYLGLWKETDATQWMWQDGTRMDHTHWYKDRQPEVADDTCFCTEMDIQDGSVWGYQRCHETSLYVRGIVCQRISYGEDDWELEKDQGIEYLYRRDAWMSCNQAMEYCSTRGGSLPIITSPQSNDFVVNYGTTPKQDVYLGYFKPLGDSDWLWQDGTTSNFTKWIYTAQQLFKQGFQPSDCYCAVLKWEAPGQSWDLEKCSQMYRHRTVLCQRYPPTMDLRVSSSGLLSVYMTSPDPEYSTLVFNTTSAHHWYQMTVPRGPYTTMAVRGNGTSHFNSYITVLSDFIWSSTEKFNWRCFPMILWDDAAVRYPANLDWTKSSYRADDPFWGNAMWNPGSPVPLPGRYEGSEIWNMRSQGQYTEMPDKNISKMANEEVYCVGKLEFPLHVNVVGKEFYFFVDGKLLMTSKETSQWHTIQLPTTAQAVAIGVSVQEQVDEAGIMVLSDFIWTTAGLGWVCEWSAESMDTHGIGFGGDWIYPNYDDSSWKWPGDVSENFENMTWTDAPQTRHNAVQAKAGLAWIWPKQNETSPKAVLCRGKLGFDAYVNSITDIALYADERFITKHRLERFGYLNFKKVKLPFDTNVIAVKAFYTTINAKGIPPQWAMYSERIWTGESRFQWRCTQQQFSEHDLSWTMITFDDTSWSRPHAFDKKYSFGNNRQHYHFIWAKSHTDYSKSIYCRGYVALPVLVAADNRFTLFADGNFVAEGGPQKFDYWELRTHDKWYKPSIPVDTYVIAINATNFGGTAGIGLVSSRIWTSSTEFLWKCVNAAQFVTNDTEWTESDFDDALWPTAYPSKSDSYSPGLPGNPYNGTWIWTDKVEENQTIYCRAYTSIRVGVRAAGSFTLYADSYEIINAEYNPMAPLFQGFFPYNTHVLAISFRHAPRLVTKEGGIFKLFSRLLNTHSKDYLWRCVLDDDLRDIYLDWTSPEFEDTHWPRAHILNDFRIRYSMYIYQVNFVPPDVVAADTISAEWLNPVGIDRTAYCRGHIAFDLRVQSRTDLTVIASGIQTHLGPSLPGMWHTVRIPANSKAVDIRARQMGNMGAFRVTSPIFWSSTRKFYWGCKTDGVSESFQMGEPQYDEMLIPAVRAVGFPPDRNNPWRGVEWIRSASENPNQYVYCRGYLQIPLKVWPSTSSNFVAIYFGTYKSFEIIELSQTMDWIDMWMPVDTSVLTLTLLNYEAFLDGGIAAVSPVIWTSTYKFGWKCQNVVTKTYMEETYDDKTWAAAEVAVCNQYEMIGSPPGGDFIYVDKVTAGGSKVACRGYTSARFLWGAARIWYNTTRTDEIFAIDYMHEWIEDSCQNTRALNYYCTFTMERSIVGISTPAFMLSFKMAIPKAVGTDAAESLQDEMLQSSMWTPTTKQYVKLYGIKEGRPECVSIMGNNDECKIIFTDDFKDSLRFSQGLCELAFDSKIGVLNGLFNPLRREETQSLARYLKQQHPQEQYWWIGGYVFHLGGWYWTDMTSLGTLAYQNWIEKAKQTSSGKTGCAAFHIRDQRWETFECSASFNAVVCQTIIDISEGECLFREKTESSIFFNGTACKLFSWTANNGSFPWYFANSYCQLEQNGTLVKITSQEESQRLLQFIQNKRTDGNITHIWMALVSSYFIFEDAILAPMIAWSANLQGFNLQSGLGCVALTYDVSIEEGELVLRNCSEALPSVCSLDEDGEHLPNLEDPATMFERIAKFKSDSYKYQYEYNYPYEYPSYLEDYSSLGSEIKDGFSSLTIYGLGVFGGIVIFLLLAILVAVFFPSRRYGLGQRLITEERGTVTKFKHQLQEDDKKLKRKDNVAKSEDKADTEDDNDDATVGLNTVPQSAVEMEPSVEIPGNPGREIAMDEGGYHKVVARVEETGTADDGASPEQAAGGTDAITEEVGNSEGIAQTNNGNHDHTKRRILNAQESDDTFHTALPYQKQ